MKDRKPLLLDLLLAFFVFAFGAIYIFVTPPMQTPDEPAHLFRAWQISGGGSGTGVEGGEPVHDIPAGFARMKEEASPIFGDPTKKPAAGEVWAKWSLLDSVGGPTVKAAVTGAANYPPVPYLLQAAALALSRWTDASTAAAIVAARAASLLLYCALLFVSLRLLPSSGAARLWLFAVAAMPQSIFMAISPGADATTAGLCFLIFAMSIRLCAEPSRKLFAISLATSAALTLSKPAYQFVPFLLVMHSLVGDAPGRLRRAAKSFAAVAAVTVPLWVGWSVFVWGRFGEWLTHGSVDPAAQALSVFRRPDLFAAAVAKTVAGNLSDFTRTFVGYLGWLDTPVPMPFVLAVVLTLIFLSLVSWGREAPPSNRASKALAFGVLLASVLLIFFMLYIQWTPVGQGTVEGIQGRYFIPIAPIAALFTPRLLRIESVGTRKALFAAVVALWSAVAASGADAIFSRYWR